MSSELSAHLLSTCRITFHAGLYSIALAGCGCGQLFTYPIEMYVARHVFHVSIFQTFLGMGPITSTRHYTITLLIWAFTMTVACATHDLSIVLDIFGALSSTVSHVVDQYRVL